MYHQGLCPKGVVSLGALLAGRVVKAAKEWAVTDEAGDELRRFGRLEMADLWARRRRLTGLEATVRPVR